MTRQAPPIHVRGLREADLPFIYNSWLKTYRRTELASSMAADVYFRHFHDIIEAILNRAGAKVAVAPDNHDEIHGYLVAETDPVPVLHWAYVKDAFRRFGIAHRLAEAAGLDLGAPMFYTFHSRMADTLLKGYPLAAYRQDLRLRGEVAA